MPMIGMALAVLAAVSLAAWIALLFGRGGFWRADQRLTSETPKVDETPGVVAVIPARNEAATIARTIASLRAQDAIGRVGIVVVDDGSSDGTGSLARAAGEGDPDVVVIDGLPLAPGWTGKLWAVKQGVAEAARRWPGARYLLLTDADIEHGPGIVAALIAKAEAEGRDLVSLMVLLRCRSFWERLLIPPFVFFFQKLYPFPRVNDPRRSEAAAAGGCVLVRRAALERAGGVSAVRDRLIDDCALAALLKRRGAIWLGLTTASMSLRTYEHLSEVWRMVARTAYTQLDHRPANLVGTVVGMTILYLVPPLAAGFGAVAGDATNLVTGGLAWIVMMGLFVPTPCLYGQPIAWAAALPVAALLYTAMTVDSARRHHLGRGGAWKGRTYAPAPTAAGDAGEDVV